MTLPGKWTRITEAENIPEHEGRSVRAGSRELAIFNLGDRFATIDNACPHQGGPLCDGIVAGTAVVCPLHGWRFDLDSGLAVRASLPACITVYPTRVENGVILVNIGAGRREAPEDAAA
ncbi:MAG TPA: nitrite reductase small subunit NirD [Bryobacteraceae bacterium]|jgi:nitrite reductase (NADH) small subunit|nr:nitrite reductase small subunit NirD [Bryobacteraceae bacterium]